VIAACKALDKIPMRAVACLSRKPLSWYTFYGSASQLLTFHVTAKRVHVTQRIFPNHKIHRAAHIFVSLAPSQTPV